MIVIRSVAEMQRISLSLKRSGKSIGFVPTMGYLHEGHLSLMRLAKQRCDTLVVSIFVNPMQFGQNEDFARYPRDFARDESLCEKENVDIVFYPDEREIYPEDFRTRVIVSDLRDRLCGRSRPGHFDGVTTIVAKLFNIVLPDIAVFGQKDAQQAIIIKRMTEDLNFPIEIVVSPTVREHDGLAMSSRNKYLSQEEREKATILYRALSLAKEKIEKKEISSAGEARELIRKQIDSVGGFVIDYIEVVDAVKLEPISDLRGKEALIALAVRIGTTRLIDNVSIKFDRD